MLKSDGSICVAGGGQTDRDKKDKASKMFDVKTFLLTTFLDPAAAFQFRHSLLSI